MAQGWQGRRKETRQKERRVCLVFFDVFTLGISVCCWFPDIMIAIIGYYIIKIFMPARAVNEMVCACPPRAYILWMALFLSRLFFFSLSPLRHVFQPNMYQLAQHNVLLRNRVPARIEARCSAKQSVILPQRDTRAWNLVWIKTLRRHVRWGVNGCSYASVVWLKSKITLRELHGHWVIYSFLLNTKGSPVIQCLPQHQKLWNGTYCLTSMY